MGDVVQESPAARGARKVAMAAALALALAAGCTSSKPAKVVEAAPARAAQPASAASAPRVSPPIELRSLELREGAPEVFLELTASGPLVWTSFRNAQGQVVLELPNSTPAAAVANLSPEDGLVSAVAIERPSDAVRPLTRIVVATRQEVEHSVTADGNVLKLRLAPVEPESQQARLTFEPVDGEGESAIGANEEQGEPAPEPVAPLTSVAEEQPEPAAGAMRAGTPESPAIGPAPTGVHATRIEDVVVLNAGSGAVVRIAGDGELPYATFALSDPPRFVIDLAGVVNKSSRAAMGVASEVVERVRVGQFKPQPQPVARVVFDLRRDVVPTIERSRDSLLVRFAAGGTAAAGGAGVHPAPVEEASAETAPAEEPPAPAPALGRPQAQARVAQLSPPARPTAPAMAEAPAPRHPAVEVEEALLAPPPPPPAPVQTPRTASERPSSLPAAALASPPAPGAPPSDLQLLRSPGNTEQTTLNPAVQGLRQSDERTYVGEPIDLKVTNAEVTDVLRTFAQLSGLNIIVQPGVTGTVTAEMENVPWDQALEQVLKINKLDYVLEGNVMRIAPVSVLRQEAQERQELAAAQALAIPLSTIMKRLNYATAEEIAGLLRNGEAGLLSQRGSVIVDNRTNTLIIKELPNFLDLVVSMIEMLDTPEPQVMIEARIIETTKRFSRDLGISWGFDGVADAAHGNTTGLVFPNNVDVNGSVEVGGSTNNVLDLRLGNVLNTFNLAVQLQALESEGLIHILSAPKVATLNNQKAEIQSGLQIPIQTIANNTVTVQFVNATLRLDVTPQVTADGTVVMDIDISKREPLQAFLVPGANNAPISTKDARTRLVVRDGGTAVIGGIYKLTSDEGQDRIPGLANIPIIGYLFKNKSRSETNEELLIFITPRVIKL